MEYSVVSKIIDLLVERCKDAFSGLKGKIKLHCIKKNLENEVFNEILSAHGDKVFYNQTAAIFASSHIPSPSISEITGSLDGYNFDLPTFTATRENYFIKHGLYFADKADFDANFPARLAQAVEKGDREIQVMLADRAFREADDVTGLLTADIITAADRLAGNEGKHIESYTYGFVSGGHSFAISW